MNEELSRGEIGTTAATHGVAPDAPSARPAAAATGARRRIPASLLRALVLVSRFGLAAMFLVAAGAKLLTLRGFVENMTNLVEPRFVWPVTLVVIAAEVLAAVLLILPRTVRAGALLAAALLLGFAAYALYYVYALKGEPLECGCFGGLIASQLGVSTALRNLALLVPCALAFFGHPRLRRDERP
ncbi:MAG TPA: MauE/DoxX family redox-associated membrane protein [Pyrinomonadaceae bacterium]|nr:MauE/DoxX family redox-associated membrane protein [Pyrinomonadaceae bacterium]